MPSNKKKNVSPSVKKTTRQLSARTTTNTTTHVQETIMTSHTNNMTNTTPHGNITKERNHNTETNMTGTSTTNMNANSTTTTAPNATMSNMNASSIYVPQQKQQQLQLQQQQQQILINDPSMQQWANLLSNIGGGEGDVDTVDALLNNAHSRNVALTQQHIRNVQSMIENCLTFYMSKEEVENTLKEVDQFVIDLVWQKLEEQNPRFFEAYRLRLQIKEQIVQFNKLVSEQANAMRLCSMNRNCRTTVPQQTNAQQTSIPPPPTTTTTIFPISTDMISATNTSNIPVPQPSIIPYASQPIMSLSQPPQQQQPHHLLSSHVHPSNILSSQFQNISLGEQGPLFRHATSSSSLTSLLLDPQVTSILRNDRVPLLSTMHGEHIDSPKRHLFQSNQESLNTNKNEGSLPCSTLQNSLFEEKKNGT
jgi:uncharacterized protein (TIGR01589 family)